MKYVKKNSFLKFTRKDRYYVHIENFITGESWNISIKYARILRALDGKTDPYEIMHKFGVTNTEETLYCFRKNGWLCNGKGLRTFGLGSIQCPLFHPKIKWYHRILARMWNGLLMVFCLPTLFAGFLTLLYGNWHRVDHGCGVLFAYFVGVLIGLVFHEFSHACACLGYGGQWFEGGIMLIYFLPGAYVIIDYKNIKNRFKRSQVAAAGVECNIALVGIFLLLLESGIFDTKMLLAGALANFILCTFNLSLIEGLDGMTIYSELLGVENLVDKAILLTMNKYGKRRLRRNGINGKATIVCCYIVAAFQLLLPIVLVTNVVGIIELFFV